LSQENEIEKVSFEIDFFDKKNKKKIIELHSNKNMDEYGSPYYVSIIPRLLPSEYSSKVN
jgi:hypothetical protein